MDTLGLAPPAHATRLFNGADLNNWTTRDGQPAGWRVEDQVMHDYFLFFIYGAVDALGDDERLQEKLTAAEKLATMAEALVAFGTATEEQIVAKVNVLDRSADDAALAIKSAGREAAIDWAWGENDQATEKFAALLEDPANFPREVEQVMKPLENPAETNPPASDDEFDIVK